MSKLKIEQKKGFESIVKISVPGKCFRFKGEPPFEIEKKDFSFVNKYFKIYKKKNDGQGAALIPEN
jgi:hypothetical protein